MYMVFMIKRHMEAQNRLNSYTLLFRTFPLLSILIHLHILIIYSKTFREKETFGIYLLVRYIWITCSTDCERFFCFVLFLAALVYTVQQHFVVKKYESIGQYVCFVSECNDSSVMCTACVRW